MKLFDYILAGLIAGLVICLATTAQNQCESCKMYNPDAQFGLNGIYHTPAYYCVWTKGRSPEEINNTECHELCHHFVYEDYEHFCIEGKHK